MAASNATEEQRLALRQALKRQIADMRALEAAAEKDKAEQQELLTMIAAIQGKVRCIATSLKPDVHSQQARLFGKICVLPGQCRLAQGQCSMGPHRDFVLTVSSSCQVGPLCVEDLRLAACLRQVLHGGENLLDKVEELKQRSAQTKTQLEIATRQREEQQRRLEQLQVEKFDLTTQYSSLEVSSEGGQAPL